jgi:hypothetical protein
LTTREDARFLAHRHRLFELLTRYQSARNGLRSAATAVPRNGGTG